MQLAFGMGIPYEDLLKKGWRPDGKGGLCKATGSKQLSNPKSERTVSNESLAANQGEKGRTESCGDSPTIIEITSFRCRLLDIDNFIGGCKFLVDALRYSGLLEDDSPDKMEAIFRQNKVAKRMEQKTEVNIYSRRRMDPRT